MSTKLSLQYPVLVCYRPIRRFLSAFQLFFKLREPTIKSMLAFQKFRKKPITFDSFDFHFYEAWSII